MTLMTKLFLAVTAFVTFTSLWLLAHLHKDRSLGKMKDANDNNRSQLSAFKEYLRGFIFANSITGITNFTTSRFVLM